jgi:hypothetical protein
MTMPTPSISINADLTNPGQFFACCGLLELAHRLWPGAEGWFEDSRFLIAAAAREGPFGHLIRELCNALLTCDDANADPKTCPLRLTAPFGLRLDWWLDGAGGDRLKTWAGQQSILRIAPAMKEAITDSFAHSDICQIGMVVMDPADSRKSVEPFYFDARRFAHPLDAGFSLDAQGVESVAHPAVELLCLIGLQRFRPSVTPMKWSFDYWVWSRPLAPSVAAGVVSGIVPVSARRGYRFPLRFRDNQKRYKAFGFAIPIGDIP